MVKHNTKKYILCNSGNRNQAKQIQEKKTYAQSD